MVVASSWPALVSVVEDEVNQDEESHPNGEQDERVLRGPVQRQAKGDLRDTEESDGTARPTVEVNAERPTRDVLDKPSANGLQQDHHIDGNANSMVGIGEISRRSDCNKTENKNNRGKSHSEDLEIGVVSDCGSWTLSVESDIKEGQRHQEEKGDGCQNSVSEDEAVVLCQGRKPIAHA